MPRRGKLLEQCKLTPVTLVCLSGNGKGMGRARSERAEREEKE